MASAVGALMVLICIVVGFVVAMLTVIVTKILRRGVPDRIALRFGLSIVGGGVIGALGPNGGDVSTAASWLLLSSVLVVWFWRAKAAPEAEKPIE